MNHNVKRIWNYFTSLLVALVVILALLLVGARLIGYQVYTVLSGSMEPTYATGSLIYVRPTEAKDIIVGMPITYVLDEKLTVVTHRVIIADPVNQQFTTKGDANQTPDGSPVHFKNLIGTPVFTIPYLGYLANYIQKPPGMYFAIAAGLILILLVFLPDLLGEDTEKPKAEESNS